MADGRRWFFVRDGQRHGPVALSDIVDQILAATMRSDDLVWHSGLPQWTQARDVPEITHELPPPLPERLAIELASAASQPPEVESDEAGLPKDEPKQERRRRRHRHHHSPTRPRLTPVERRWLGPVILLVAGAVVGLWLLLVRLNAHPS